MYESYDASTISIVDNYIKTITFIDDEIIFNDNVADDNKINANLLMKIFASKGKSTTFLQYKNHSEKDDLLKLLVQSDTCVIDWYLKINAVDDGKCEPDEDEEDEEIQSARGPYAIELVKDLIGRNDGRLKLIVIYTAETDAEGITSDLYNELNVSGLNVVKHEECLLEVSDIKITVLFKPILKGRRLNSTVTNRIVDYDDLPDKIVRELSFFTEGLLSNTIMESINILRDGIGQLLSTFNKDLDAAFLAHRALIPERADASGLIIDSILGAIRSLFYYKGVDKILCDQFICEFLEKTCPPGHKSVFKGKDILKEDLIKVQQCGHEAHFESKGYSKGFRNEYYKVAAKNYQYTPNSPTHIDELFSILTHHKSLYKEAGVIPKLTLGVVIKGKVTNDYFVCVQQSCDSVRIEPGESRRFMFLPLYVQDDREDFNLVLKESEVYKYMKIGSANNYNLRTIRFSTDQGSVCARRDGEDFIFEPDYCSGVFDPPQERFIWICDLKDLHAQRILNEFASNMSRVGLDESEWLRKS